MVLVELLCSPGGGGVVGVGAAFDHEDVVANGTRDTVDFGELSVAVDDFEGVDLAEVLNPVVAACAAN